MYTRLNYSFCPESKRFRNHIQKLSWIYAKINNILSCQSIIRFFRWISRWKYADKGIHLPLETNSVAGSACYNIYRIYMVARSIFWCMTPAFLSYFEKFYSLDFLWCLKSWKISHKFILALKRWALVCTSIILSHNGTTH